MRGGGSAPLWLEQWHLDEPAVAKAYKHYLLNTKAGVLPRRQENLFTSYLVIRFHTFGICMSIGTD